MDLSEDDETDVPPIETPKEPSKDDHLSNALSSFYSDIAGIDGSSQETTPAPTPPKVNSPSSSLGRASPALSDDRSNSPFCADSQDESKKRKVWKNESYGKFLGKDEKEEEEILRIHF